MGLLSLVMLAAGVSDAMDVPNQLAESTMADGAPGESRDGRVTGYPSREKLITGLSLPGRSPYPARQLS